LAGALLFDEKIRQMTSIIWFGLRDVGILQIQAVIQDTLVVSSAFLEHSSAEKIAAVHIETVKQAGGLQAFL
jgi:hypothetical protein